MGVNNKVQDNNYPKPNRSDKQFQNQEEFIEPTGQDLKTNNEAQIQPELPDGNEALPADEPDSIAERISSRPKE